MKHLYCTECFSSNNNNNNNTKLIKDRNAIRQLKESRSSNSRIIPFWVVSTITFNSVLDQGDDQVKSSTKQDQWPRTVQCSNKCLHFILLVLFRTFSHPFKYGRLNWPQVRLRTQSCTHVGRLKVKHSLHMWYVRNCHNEAVHLT